MTIRRLLTRLPLLIALLLLAAPAVIGVQAQSPTIRAIWTIDTLVLINTSGDGVDLSSLTLATAAGQIAPENWILNTDDSGVSYSLTNVRPGSCLVAYLAGNEPRIPESVTCSRVIAEAPLINLGDLVWDVTAGGFTPTVAGTAGSLCDVLSGTSCEIAVAPANLTPPPGDVPVEVAVRALWNNEVFVLINVGEYGADFAGLTLTSDQGEITPADWVMAINPDTTTSYTLRNLRPGSCLVAYLSVQGTTNPVPTLPANVTCTRIAGVFTPETIEDLVWSLEGNGFTPTVGSTAGAKCEIVGSTSCNLSLPNADLNEDTTVATAEAAAAGVRALWNREVLVVLNVSDAVLDLSDLTLLGDLGDITPDNWVMQTDDAGVSYSLSEVHPGSCLVAYLSTQGTANVAPDLPENVTCDEVIGLFTAASLEDLVWSLENNGFTPSVGGSTGAKCEVVGTTSCEIAVP